ncbi:MAG: hypothetical protein JOZ54_14845 [Acidobacteria bacterium]|nr:hypothetical protein [Acidobacteriota bacterium]
MSSTLLRLGLWILVIVLALYVIHESFEDSPVAELVPLEMLQNALYLGGVVLIAGGVLRLFEKGTRKVVKNRCSVCRTPIPHGALYCRQHLRRILHKEDERTHITRIRADETLTRRATMTGQERVPGPRTMADRQPIPLSEEGPIRPRATVAGQQRVPTRTVGDRQPIPVSDDGPLRRPGEDAPVKPKPDGTKTGQR